MSHPEAATLERPWTGARHAELFFSLVAEGKIDVSSLISHRYSYGDAPQAYAMLLEDRSHAMGVILDWRP
jgi:threonine dehydrogenase-like Zn-dependent dehydrogenase